MARALSDDEVRSLGLEAGAHLSAGRELSPQEAASLGLEDSPSGPEPSSLESFASGLGQAAGGFGDEIGAGIQARMAAAKKYGLGVALAPTNLPPDPELHQEYRRALSENRQVDAAAKEQHPGLYYGGMVGGAIATAPLLPGMAAGKGAGIGAKVAAGAVTGMGQGALFGAGTSEADGNAGQLAVDTALGAAGGGVLGGAGAGLGHGLGSAASALGSHASAGAAERGAEEAAAQVAAARGSYGAQVQQANRLVENLQRLASNGNATPAQLAQLQKLKPVLADLEQRLLDSSMRDLPGMANDVEGGRASYQAVAGNQAQIAQDAAERIKGPAEALRQVGMRAKRYALPAIGAALGNTFGPAGHAAGMMAGGALNGAEGAAGALAGAGLRPMAHALVRMVTHPSILNTGAKVLGAGARVLGGASAAGAPLEGDVFTGITDMVRHNPEAMGAFAGYFSPEDDDDTTKAKVYALQQTNPDFAKHLRELQSATAE